MTLSISNSEAITCCDAIVDSCDTASSQTSPLLVIYSGTAPANVDTALSGNTVLAELEMSNPAFGDAVDAGPGATATANAISNDTAANATGTASFFRIFDRAASRKARIQGTVTVTSGGGELELPTLSIVADVAVSISSLTITQPEA